MQLTCPGCQSSIPVPTTLFADMQRCIGECVYCGAEADSPGHTTKALFPKAWAGADCFAANPTDVWGQVGKQPCCPALFNLRLMTRKILYAPKNLVLPEGHIWVKTDKGYTKYRLEDSGEMRETT